MAKGKIKNIGVLDLRSATEKSVEAVERIDNVGSIICSPETSHLIPKISIGNIGSTTVISDEYEMITGKIEITGESLGKLSKPLFLYITGSVVIKDDVRFEDAEKNIGGLIVIGKIVCPEKLVPAIQSRVVNHTGKLLSYPAGAKFINGQCTLNDAFLSSLEPSSFLFISGKLKATGKIDGALFKERVARIELAGKSVIAEENYELLSLKLTDASKCEVIPRDFIHIEDDIEIDSVSIKKFTRSKIYTGNSIMFRDDVTTQMLESHISAIKTTGIIICKQELRELVVALCEGYSPKVIHYSGRLVIIDQEYELDPAELEFSDCKVAFLVRGELRVADDLAPELILDKIESIDNFGTIEAGRRQIGAIKNRLRTNEGEIVNVEKSENADDNTCMSNAGYLKL